MQSARTLGIFATTAVASAFAHSALAIREVDHNPAAVINVHVARGVVTLLQLPDDDPLRFVAVGRSADCAKLEDAWCVSAPADSNLIFAKPKSKATAPNNIEAVAASGRKYSFRLVVGDEGAATQRLVVRAARQQVRGPSFPGLAPFGSLPAGGRVEERGAAPSTAMTPPAPVRPLSSPAPMPRVTVISRDDPELVELRLSAGPRIVNSEYSLAIGEKSDDIVPTAVFDDALFTYLRLPGNREVPAVFHVMADGQESMVNTRMEDDMLVVDRVSRLMRLRVGNQVVSVINEAFDLDGRSVNKTGMTVSGVQRTVRPIPQPSAAQSTALPAGLLPQARPR
jgi:type IV secretion system protein VirB9